MDRVPDWAWHRTDELVVHPSELPKHTNGWAAKCDRLRAAFARYIAEHEEPPVDALLIEARKIAADAVLAAKEAHGGWWADAEEYISGDKDASPGVRAVLTALKRGMELARGETTDGGEG